MAASGGAFGLAEAELVGRAFLASPAATHVAAGHSTNSMLAVVALYNDSAGRPCRVIEQTVMINGSPVRARGDMCRGGDGAWALSPGR
jgi:surface antigen